MKLNKSLPKFLLAVLVVGVVLYIVSNLNGSPLPNSGELEMESQPMNDYSEVQPSSGDNSEPAPVSSESDAQAIKETACFPKDSLNPSELLPASSDNMWGEVNPQQDLANQNFLESGRFVGINTVSSGANKNPNLQLRSDPIIDRNLAKGNLWNNSTIEGNTFRRALEIGSGC